MFLQATRRFFHSSPFFATRVEQNPKVVEEAGQVLHNRLALINEQLKDHEWVAGPFSLADLTLLAGVDFAAASQFTLDPAWAQLGRWHEAMKRRPSAAA